MIVKYLLPLMAIAGVGLAVYTVAAENNTKPPAPPVVDPASAPYSVYVAGAGLVEASTENISIGSPVAGIVQSVAAKAGDRVKAGDPLFTVDDRSVRAEVDVREQAVAVAEAKVKRLEAQPRREDVPPAEARVAAERAVVDDLESQLAMWERADRAAVSSEELSKRRYAVATAKARLLEAEASLDLLKAGAWSADLAVARAEVASAKAQLDAARVELARHTVSAPVAGEILKVNARLGEFVQAGALGDASVQATGLMILGETQTLHVRVDVDENDAWRVKAGAPAKAYVRGNPELNTGLEFVRFEPYVIPKRSLTGASTERVDTRVLQVIYRFDRAKLPVFVGQQMDVFIDAQERAAAPTGG